MESCESDPVYRESSVSIDVPKIVNAGVFQIIDICFCLSIDSDILGGIVMEDFSGIVS